MTINWDQIPLEMKEEVVKELDVGTRVNLSMCSKSDNQLVRDTKYGKLKGIHLDGYNFEITVDHKRENKDRVLVRPREDGGSKVYFVHERWVREKYSTTNDWKETIMNIMSLIGTSIKVEYLELKTGRNFKETFKWLRNNVQLNPKYVSISVDSFTDHYDESIWDWPSDTKIDLSSNYCRLSNLERFNIYDKIVSLNYREGNYMTDEELKKFRNAKYVKLYNCAVTINGFILWFKQSMTRTNDKEGFSFWMRFKRVQEIRIEDLRNRLSSFIEKIERCSGSDFGFSEDYWKIDIKKDEKARGTIKLSNLKMHFEYKELYTV